ncbi:HEPN domain-containing protein [Candidatus Latescibacterota bacterium]
MTQQPVEWLKQADYNMETADFMFSGGRYFYAVFISHISIEKALKGDMNPCRPITKKGAELRRNPDAGSHSRTLYSACVVTAAEAS